LAAAVLGTAFGRVVAHRGAGVRAAHVAVSVVAIVTAVVVLVPRSTPALSADIRTSPAGHDAIDVEVLLTPADGADGAERFQVMAWQGGELAVAHLREVERGRFVTDEPVPVGGDGKALVRIAHGGALGAIPISMPADPAIGADEVPLLPRRQGPFLAESHVLLREAHTGPAWPAVVGYTFVALGVGTVIGLLLAATVGLDRRRRALGWRNGDGTLAGTRVVLTGCEGGIGLAAKRALEGQGARVVGIDVRAGGRDCLVADLRDPDAVRAAIDEAAARLGGIDVLVANAGIGAADETARPPSAEARDVMDVNCFGSWEVIGQAMPHLRRGGGHVVVVGSGLARVNMPYSAAYTASKRALVGYADVLRLEEDGAVTVSVVQPAYIRTPIHDGPAAHGASLDGVARVETVQDAAAAIVTACETHRRELGSSPVTTLQLWAARHWPAVVDRAVAQRRRQVERRRPRPVFPDRSGDRSRRAGKVQA
ncbi:MAG TPA: SDR family NAD(P)-dependent oxidoreductase, partial [Egibacteraceae bacterium]|nr:SDR family NAD(P)-dependent oxidoreductase [Egibacteraceae bacterium]